MTILATALVETGSRMDEVIFEEFKGTGNMELRLDRKLAERRIYPAIDVNASSTRHEELLFDRVQLQQVWKLRRVLNALAAEGSGAAGLELLMDRIKSTRTNDEFLAEVAKNATAAPVDADERYPMKTDIHPELRRRHGDLLVRQHLHHPLDQVGASHRAVQRVPPVLHGQAEAGRHRRPGRALRAALRTAGQEVADEDLARLRALKLRALVRGRWVIDGDARTSTSALPGGSALAEPRRGRGWVLIDDGAVPMFGGALAWALRGGLESLDVLVDDSAAHHRAAHSPGADDPGADNPVRGADDPGADNPGADNPDTDKPGGGVPWAAGAASVISRRARELADPPGVWEVRCTGLLPASPATSAFVNPEEAGGGESHEGLVDLMREHGVEPVWEHGVLRGEYLGLEVARVVSARLEVGVGRHDRAARSQMRPGEDPGAALDEVVAAVRARRRPGAAPHPANTLARARWLRSVVCSRPEIVGAAFMDPVAPPLPWFDLSESGSAPCVGRLEQGGAIVAVCSVGVDVDLIPTAADCRALHSPGAALVVVVPEGDDVPLLHEMSGLLSKPRPNHHRAPSMGVAQSGLRLRSAASPP